MVMIFNNNWFNRFLYNLIWSARKEKSLPKWWLVGMIAFVQLLWLPLLIATPLYLISKSGNASEPFLMFPMTLIFWFFMESHTLVSFTSVSYSIAADTRRMINNGKKNIFTILSYFLWGSLAVISALSFLTFRLYHLSWINTQQLDVVGNVISKIKWESLATKIHDEIYFRWKTAKHSAHKIIEEEVTALSSLVLCYKWMAEMYGKHTEEGQQFLKKIEEILTQYPKFPPEVKTRLLEALERNEEALEQEELIATQ